MKNINHFLLALAATLSVTANAQTESDAMQPEVVDPVVQVETTTTSKPYMHILLPANSFVPDGFELEKYGNADYGLPFQVYLQRESVVSYEGGDAVDFFCSVENVVNKETSEVENLKVTYLFDDRYYALEGSKIKVSLPKVSYKVDEEVKDLEDISFIWTVSDLFVLDHDAKYSELADKLANATSVVVKAPYCLTIDGSDISTINQLIVEGGANEEELAAGVVINEGATLNITDTAYYLCKETSNRQMGYLINRGAYTATSSIFTKYVPQEINTYYTGEDEDWKESVFYFLSCPVKETSLTWVLLKDNDLGWWKEKEATYEKNTPLWYFSIQSVWESDETYDSTFIDIPSKPGVYTNFRGKGLGQYHRGVCSQVEPAVLRFAGDINDESEYELPLFVESSYVIKGNTYENTYEDAFLDNFYQAPLDLRDVAVNDPTFATVNTVHIQGIYGYKSGFDYNIKTGLTTFDGPMYYGYLAPHMSHMAFYRAEKISEDQVVVEPKKSVTSYKEADEKYSNAKLSEYPYVRFYVDDPDKPKISGNRNVFVAYFLDYMTNGDDCYASVVNSEADGYDPMWGLNLKWEVPIEMENSDDAFVPYPPYVGAKSTFYRNPAAIKVFSKPTVDSLIYSDVNDELYVIAMKDAKRVTLGVLDYDLDNICVEVAGLKVNSPDTTDILETEIVFEANDSVISDYNLFMHWNQKYYAQLLKYKFKRFTYHKPEIPDTPEPPLGVDDLNLFDATVSAGKGYVLVTSSVPSTISVFDLTGNEVSPSLLCSNSAQISLKSGVYIVNINSSDHIITKKVLVK